jgi:hypothetical protein
MAGRTQAAQVGEVEGQPLITTMGDDVINARREAHALLLEAQHTQRLGVQHLGPQSVRPTPARVVVDGRAVAVPLLLIGSGVNGTAPTADRRVRTGPDATGASGSRGHQDDHRHGVRVTACRQSQTSEPGASTGL